MSSGPQGPMLQIAISHGYAFPDDDLDTLKAVVHHWKRFEIMNNLECDRVHIIYIIIYWMIM